MTTTGEKVSIFQHDPASGRSFKKKGLNKTEYACKKELADLAPAEAIGTCDKCWKAAEERSIRGGLCRPCQREERAL